MEAFFSFPAVGAKVAEHPILGRELCYIWANIFVKAEGKPPLKLSFLCRFGL